MTMHGARGREFGHVFVLGLQSARMPGAPRRRSPSRSRRAAARGAPPDTRAAHVAEMRRLLHVAMTRARRGLVLAYAARSDRGALQPPSPFAEEARAALGAEWEDRDEELFGPDETLHATFPRCATSCCRSVRASARGSASCGSTPTSTSPTASCATSSCSSSRRCWRGPRASRSPTRCRRQRRDPRRRPPPSSARSCRPAAGRRAARRRARRPRARRGDRRARRAVARAVPPTRGDGLLLSASDIETYRTCPLKYKFARVFRIPSEPTLNQRFGILVHQVLERYHQEAAAHAGRRAARAARGGLAARRLRRPRPGAPAARQGRGGPAPLPRALRAERAEPVWFEKAFQFRLGAHTLRGRVDRVDRLPDGGYELIDYKTGRPKTACALREDVQLALYAVGAREAWDVEASRQSYLYVLDDEKVPLPTQDVDPAWITDTVARGRRRHPLPGLRADAVLGLPDRLPWGAERGGPCPDGPWVWAAMCTTGSPARGERSRGMPAPTFFWRYSLAPSPGRAAAPLPA